VKRYGIIGTPEQCAEQLERFRAAGLQLLPHERDR